MDGRVEPERNLKTKFPNSKVLYIPLLQPFFNA